jgi:aconitate decarboxylase
LRRLPFEAARNAIALSASMAGGLVANFGTMTKPLHAGRASSGGVEAVRLAMLGMTAAPDALEHPAGFLRALSPGGRLDLDKPVEAGATLRILESRLSIKKYPICYATHRVIDGVIDAVRREDVLPAQVEAVHAEIGRTQAQMLRNHAPQTGLEAKFSLEFAVASALIAREVGLSQLTDQFVRRPDVQAAMRRVSTSTTAAACPIEPAFGYADRVRIRLTDGRELDSGEIRFARGNARRPLSEEDLKAKFMDCVRRAASGGGERLYAQLARLESVEARSLTVHG